MNRDDARQVVLDGAGSHFDPRMVAVFLRLERDGLITREASPALEFEPVGIPGFDTDERPRADLN